MRALLVSLDEWVTTGKEPPASRYPSLKDGTLVRPQEAGYTGLPGLKFQGEYIEMPLVDYSAIRPKAGPEYPVFTAKVDGDGHAVAGIRLPQIEAPTATFLGWNLRKSGFAEGALCGLTGSTIPLARSKAERASDDRRMTLEERYPTHSDYVSAILKAADRLVGDRILLPSDAERIVRQAEAAEIDRPRP